MRQYLIAAAGILAVQAAAAASASAQTVTFEQLMQQLDGKPVADQPMPPTSGRIFRSRSFTAKETDPVEHASNKQPQPPVSPAVVQHPEVDIEIYFAPASSRITKQAEPDLTLIGRVLSHEKYTKAKFRIAGHTDGIGGDTYNLRLSQRRAEAVRNYLISRFKIPAQRIEAVGFGKQQLKVPDDVASARNRRVQIVNLSATK